LTNFTFLGFKFSGELELSRNSSFATNKTRDLPQKAYSPPKKEGYGLIIVLNKKNDKNSDNKQIYIKNK
jgi:hypothetical protein